MYKEISVKEELPPLNKWVTTIDEAGNHRVYRRTENGWNMRDVNGIESPADDLEITHWLKEGNQYLFSYHLSRRSDEGWGRYALVFASNVEEAEEKLIKEKTIPQRYANAGLAWGSQEDLVPDHIYCLNID